MSEFVKTERMKMREKQARDRGYLKVYNRVLRQVECWENNKTCRDLSLAQVNDKLDWLNRFDKEHRDRTSQLIERVYKLWTEGWIDFN